VSKKRSYGCLVCREHVTPSMVAHQNCPSRGFAPTLLEHLFVGSFAKFQTKLAAVPAADVPLVLVPVVVPHVPGPILQNGNIGVPQHPGVAAIVPQVVPGVLPPVQPLQVIVQEVPVAAPVVSIPVPAAGGALLSASQVAFALANEGIGHHNEVFIEPSVLLECARAFEHALLVICQADHDVTDEQRSALVAQAVGSSWRVARFSTFANRQPYIIDVRTRLGLSATWESTAGVDTPRVCVADSVRALRSYIQALNDHMAEVAAIVVEDGLPPSVSAVGVLSLFGPTVVDSGKVFGDVWQETDGTRFFICLWGPYPIELQLRRKSKKSVVVTPEFSLFYSIARRLGVKLEEAADPGVTEALMSALATQLPDSSKLGRELFSRGLMPSMEDLVDSAQMNGCNGALSVSKAIGGLRVLCAQCFPHTDTMSESLQIIQTEVELMFSTLPVVAVVRMWSKTVVAFNARVVAAFSTAVKGHIAFSATAQFAIASCPIPVFHELFVSAQNSVNIERAMVAAAVMPTTTAGVSSVLPHADRPTLKRPRADGADVSVPKPSLDTRTPCWKLLENRPCPSPNCKGSHDPALIATTLKAMAVAAAQSAKQRAFGSSGM
jgi:hypothetical protein